MPSAFMIFRDDTSQTGGRGRNVAESRTNGLIFTPNQAVWVFFFVMQVLTFYNESTQTRGH